MGSISMADQPIDPALGKIVQDPESPKGKGKKKLIIILGLFVFIVVVVVSVIFFAPGLLPFKINLFGEKKQSEAKEPANKKQGHLYSMDSFVVNLADTDLPRYLKIKIEIEGHEPKPDEGFANRLPQLRDAILTILSSKTFKEIYDTEGKKKLKEEITLKANQLQGGFKVKTIYFTEFVVQ